MARLRLFANLRELAGTSEVEVDAATVEGVLDQAGHRFGSDFRRGVDHAKVWLNGLPAAPGDPVHEGDEVAVIPPVSGGATALGAGVQVPTLVMLAVVAVGVLANTFGSDSWYAAALVGIIGMWALDLATEAEATDYDLPIAPVLASALVGVLASYRFGTAGLGLALAFAVIGTFTWGVAFREARDLVVLAPAMVLSVVAGLAGGSLMAARMMSDGGAGLVGAFLLATIGAGLAAWISSRFARIPLLDPMWTSALAAIVLALLGSVVWNLDPMAMLLVGVAIAAGSLAGRALGSMVRTGQVYLVERSPGMLTALDGAVVAATLLVPVYRLFS